MEYKGKLYGKLGGMHFDTGKTSEDWDNLEAKVNELQDAVNKNCTIPVVMPSVYGIFKHGMDKVYGYYWSLETAEEICNEMNGEDYYVDELCVDEH